MRLTARGSARLFPFLAFLLVLLAPVQANERANAPKTMPDRIAGAWHRLQGSEGENLLYLHAAAEKFNVPVSALAAVALTDLLTHHADWTTWAAENPEVRSEGRVVHIAPASALSEGLLRADLVIPEARKIFDRKRNDISYMMNPQPGVDHWYQSCLEAADELMKDDGVQIGVLGRQLRRTADGTVLWSSKLELAYARPSTEDVRRRLSQAGAWPEGAALDWDRLKPGRGHWTLPALAWVYGRYRMRSFDAEPHDELVALAAQVYAWLQDQPDAWAALQPEDSDSPLIAYTDTTEDYSFR